MKLLIKRIFLILLGGMFLWFGTSCAPRPLRSTGTVQGWEIQVQDRLPVLKDAGARQNSTPSVPLPDTAKQVAAPQRTAPEPVRAEEKTPDIKSEPKHS